MINIKKKLIFLHSKKTGGSSIRVALTGFDDIGLHGMDNHNELMKARGNQIGDWIWISSHPSLSIIRKYLKRLGENIDEYFIFTIVRNPFARAVSVYNYMRTRPNKRRWHNLTWEQFMSSKLGTNRLKTATYNHTVEGDKEGIVHVIRYERLQEGWAVIAERFGYDPILPRYNTAEEHLGHNKHYTEYFENEEQIKKVEAIYREEIENFGYSYGDPA